MRLPDAGQPTAPCLDAIVAYGFRGSSPTYYGMVADVAGIARACRDAGAALVVDQSWGPHFGFHPDVLQSALTHGADAVLASTHKARKIASSAARLRGASDPAFATMHVLCP